MSANEPGAGVRFVAVALVVTSAVGLNRFALERWLAFDGEIGNALSQWLILAGQALLLLLAAGLHRYGSRLGRGVVLGAALLFAPLALAGIVGSARALGPRSDLHHRIAAMERSEELYLSTGPRMKALGDAALELELPGSARHRLFADGFRPLDDLSAEPGDAVPALAEVGRAEWRITEAADGAAERLWAPFLESVRYFERAGFKIVHAQFGGDGEAWETELRFAGLARLRDGRLAQADAEVDAVWRQSPDGEWRIASWRNRGFGLALAREPFFEDVGERMLVDPDDRERARASLHDGYVVEHFQTGRAPHDYFTYQNFDRHPGVAVADVDGDGWDDLYVMREFGANLLLRGEPDGTLRDVAGRYGLDVDGFSSSGVFADLDNDGDRDLILGRTLRPSLYLVNQDGRFTDRTEERVPGGLPRLVSSVSVADYDRDGLLDVYFATYAAEMFYSHPGAPEQFLSPAEAEVFRERSRESHWLQARVGPPNALFRNAGGGRLEVAPASKELQVWRNSYQATWSDHDRDGDPDLYVVNDFAENVMFANDGAGGFRDVTAQMHASDLGFGMGASFGDYDNDGAVDLYVSNMFSKAGQRIIRNLGPAAEEFAPLARGNTLLRGGAAGFERVSGAAPPALQVERTGWSWGSQFVDVNNDGYLDIYALNGYYTAPAAISIPVDT